MRLIGSTRSTGLLVQAGQTATLNIQVGVSALQLEQVVVTGTGSQVEIKKLGNTIATIHPPAFAPISTPSQLLQARDASVLILPASGIAGEGSRIRIRGNASLSMSNEPIVFIDGVRINTAGGGMMAGGGGSVSRLDDIDPSSIDRVEVLKGAAAATLYGTEASNGVIQIFTKKGSSGQARWSFNAEQSGTNYDVAEDQAELRRDQNRFGCRPAGFILRPDHRGVPAVLHQRVGRHPRHRHGFDGERVGHRWNVRVHLLRVGSICH